MRASAVLRQMLESGLREEQEGRVTLHGKSGGELREVLSFVDPPDLAGPPAVNAANVDVLLRWADEYQMEALRDLCEQFLLACPDGDPVLLRVALRYGLAQRTDRCLRAMAANIPGHMHSLREFLQEPQVMEALGPSICRAARVDVSADAFSPGGGSLQSLWPFVERAVAAGRPRVQRGVGGGVGLAGEAFVVLSLGLALCELFATTPAAAADVPLEAEIRVCGSLAGALLGCASVVPVVQAVSMSVLVLHMEPGPRENWFCAFLVAGPGTLTGTLAAAGVIAAEPALVAWQIGKLWALVLASSFLATHWLNGHRFARPAWRMLTAFWMAPLAPALGARLLSGEAACRAARELLLLAWP